MRFRTPTLLIALILSFSLVAFAQSTPQNIATYAHPSTFTDLDPSSGYSSENVVMGNVYETLTRYALDGTVVPHLAAGWDISDDGLQWTFTLREGITFHDGADFDASAVVGSIHRSMEINLGGAFILDPIENVEALDSLTVRFDLSYAAPLDLILSSTYAAWMINPTHLDKPGTWFNEGNDAGTGPYMITNYIPGATLVTEAYADYWGGWTEDGFGTVVYEIVEEPTLREQMIRSGEADFTYLLPYTSYPTLEFVPEVTVSTMPALQSLYGLLNTRKAPLDDVRVRQALVASFPYELVRDNLYGGLGTVPSGAVPSGVWGALVAEPYTQDLDLARQLLADAGYPDGGFSVMYSYMTADFEQQMVGELWRADLAKIGISLDVRGFTWEAQWDLAQNDPENAQDIFIMYWWPSYVTPHDFLFSMFRTEEAPFFNLGYYSNEEVDGLIDLGAELSGPDRAQAIDLFQQAQQIIRDEAATVMMLEIPDVHVIRSDITGYQNNPAYPNTVFWHELRK